MLQDEKIGTITAMYFNAVLIVPLDDSPNLLVIRELDDHRSLRSHLLDVVIILSVGHFRWYAFPRQRPIAGHLVLDFG
jgi:hypothetical protein